MPVQVIKETAQSMMELPVHINPKTQVTEPGSPTSAVLAEMTDVMQGIRGKVKIPKTVELSVHTNNTSINCAKVEHEEQEAAPDATIPQVVKLHPTQIYHFNCSFYMVI